MCKEKKNSIYDQYHIHHICLNTINVILVAKKDAVYSLSVSLIIKCIVFPLVIRYIFHHVNDINKQKNNQNMWNSSTHSTHIIEPTQTKLLLS